MHNLSRADRRDLHKYRERPADDRRTRDANAGGACRVTSKKKKATSSHVLPPHIRAILERTRTARAGLAPHEPSRFPIETLEENERRHIERALLEHGGNISATAKALGIYRSSLQRKLRKLCLRECDEQRSAA